MAKRKRCRHDVCFNRGAIEKWDNSSLDETGKGVQRGLDSNCFGWHFPSVYPFAVLLEICHRGNHISLYSWLIKCFLNIHGWQLVLIDAYVKCLWNFYMYEYSKMFLVGIHVSTHTNIRLAHILVNWLYFTSYGHGNVKLIMWVHVRHETELTQHEMMTSHYTICTLCPKTWDHRMYSKCEPTYLGASPVLSFRGPGRNKNLGPLLIHNVKYIYIHTLSCIKKMFISINLLIMTTLKIL